MTSDQQAAAYHAARWLLYRTANTGRYLNPSTRHAFGRYVAATGVPLTDVTVAAFLADGALQALHRHPDDPPPIVAVEATP